MNNVYVNKKSVKDTQITYRNIKGLKLWLKFEKQFIKDIKQSLSENSDFTSSESYTLQTLKEWLKNTTLRKECLKNLKYDDDNDYTYVEISEAWEDFRDTWYPPQDNTRLVKQYINLLRNKRNTPNIKIKDHNLYLMPNTEDENAGGVI